MPPADRNKGGQRPESVTVTVLGYVWALLPMLTLGFLTWLVIASAAIRLRNSRLGWGAAAYFAFLGVWTPNPKYGPGDVQYEATMLTWMLVSVVGGTVQAFKLRERVFRPRASRERAIQPGGYGGPAPQPDVFRGGSGVSRTRVETGSWDPWGAPAPGGSGAHERPRAFGAYTVVSRLGEGGQGTVYLGAAPDGRQVAIKVLHERLGGTREHLRFTREVTAAKRVPPFSTARILDVGFEDEAPYIVSEYVPGSSLERLVRVGGPLSADSLVRLAIATSAALNGIHSVDVVHRDFKPGNVLIGADGPRVIDFGIAKALDRATMTSGVVKGTPAYMSPEQVAGLPIGPETDVFSWASTMYYAATGHQAFDGRTVFQVFEAVLHHRPDLSAFPSSLRGPMESCLDKEPRNRPTPAELMVAIAR